MSIFRGQSWERTEKLEKGGGIWGVKKLSCGVCVCKIIDKVTPVHPLSAGIMMMTLSLRPPYVPETELAGRGQTHTHISTGTNKNKELTEPPHTQNTK